MSNTPFTHIQQLWDRFRLYHWMNGLVAACLLLLAAIPAAAQAPSPYLGSVGYMPDLAPDVEPPVQLLDSAAAKQKLYLPVLNQRPPACTLKSNPNFFGVQLYGGLDRRDPYYPWLEASGADWIRTFIPWTHVEPTNTTPDNYNWRLIDQVLAPAVEGCYHIIGTHGSAPDWAASKPSGLLDRTSLSELVQYMVALVERYDGDGVADAPGSPVVNYWEMYNEPDISQDLPGEGGWGEFGAEYAQMLAAVYPAIKAANPYAKVLFGGIAYVRFLGEDPEGVFIRSFLDDVLAADGGAFFDYMNFHSYGEMPEWSAPIMLHREAEIRQILAKHGVTKPFVITETGWYSNFNSDGEIQARYTTELYTHGKVGGIKILIHFTLADLDNNPFDTGLITSSTTGNPVAPKPALKAFQTAVNMLQNTDYVRTVPGEPTVEAYEFADRSLGRTIYVAWLNPVKSTAKESVILPVHSADLYDIYGSFLGTRSASDGTLTLDVTAQPVYAIEK